MVGVVVQVHEITGFWSLHAFGHRYIVARVLGVAEGEKKTGYAGLVFCLSLFLGCFYSVFQ